VQDLGSTLVVHLVWAPLGPDPLGRFLESYVRHDAGTAHGLLVILNGFGAGEDRGPWRELLAGVDHEKLDLDRPLLDLGAYAEAVRRMPAERYCFLNSYSVLLADRWLLSMAEALTADDVGLVGATGSWASVSSFQRFQLGMGGTYASVFPDRRAALAAMNAVAARHARAPEVVQRRAPVRYARTLLEQAYRFPPFPAPHIRTNAFMLDGALWSRLSIPNLLGKVDAHRLESGRGGLTAQVERLGLGARVVGRDGRAYAPDDWAASRTLWQGDQENLLVADNQTEDYALGGPAERDFLSRFAWATAAEPQAHAAEVR
jgi:hypothetical protein